MFLMSGDVQTAENIIYDLGENSCPVDRVNCSQMVTVFKFNVAENAFDKCLGIIKCPVNRNVEDIGIANGRHLLFLDLTNTIMRMQDKDIYTLFALDAMNCCTAGISGSGADDIQTCVVTLQEIGEKVS